MNCETNNCYNEAVAGRCYCHKCRKRSWRKANPVKAVFSRLKQRARRDGIIFSLTYEWFEGFIKRNPDYMKKRGRTKDALQIDRKIETVGYVNGNLQILTTSKNVKKMHRNYAKGTGRTQQEEKKLNKQLKQRVYYA
jgi:hypothetical protein